LHLSVEIVAESAVKNASECRRRAQECVHKAEAASNPADRIGWMELAEDWTTLSTLPFRVAPRSLEDVRIENDADRSGWLKRLLRA
jgi:hypothetical protein